MLIKALDHGSSTDPEERQLAKQRLAELLTDDSVRFAMTPLIRYEFLRKVGWDDYERSKSLEASLKEFQEFIIDKDVLDIAKLEPLYERLIKEQGHLAKDNTNNEENT